MAAIPHLKESSISWAEPDGMSDRKIWFIDVAENEFDITVRRCHHKGVAPAIGIIPTTIIARACDSSEIVKNSFFVSMLGSIFGGCSYEEGEPDIKVEAATTAVGMFLRLKFCAHPRPKLKLVKSNGEIQQINFARAIPAGTYRASALLQDGATVEIINNLSCKRRRLGPAASLSKMWTDKLFTDAQVQCQDRSFDVHRSVLCTTSPVFASAFQTSLKEGMTATISIADASADVVEQILAFIYTGTFDTDFAAPVLPIAHRYQLEELVAECCSQLVEHVSVDNVARAVHALRPLREQADVKQYWDHFAQKVQNDAALTRTALEQI